MTCSEKIPYGQVADGRSHGIQLLPIRNASPGDHQIIPILADNIGAAIAVEITQQQGIHPVSFASIKETPFSLPSRRVVPCCTGCQEQVLNTIAIKITHAKLRG